jgi:hypothetical protein
VTVLTVRLDCADDAAGTPVVVEVAPHPRGERRTAVGRAGGHLEFDLRDGLYAVRAELPSGRSIAESVLLPAGRAEVQIDLGDALALVTDSAQRSWGEFRDDAWIRLWQRTEAGWQVIPWSFAPSTWTPSRTTYRLPAADGPRMVQTSGDGTVPRFAVLPAAAVDVTVRPAAGDDPWLAVFVTTLDPAGEALRAYLASGDLSRARLIAGSVTPDGAAARTALGLLRLRDPDPAASAPVSDDLIIDAWSALRSGHGEGVARADLLAAASGMLPVYPACLRLLVEGLQRFEDAETRAALAALDPYLAAADLTQTTVAFAGSIPDRPDLYATNGATETLPHAERLAPRADAELAGLADDLLDVTSDVREWRLPAQNWASIERTLRVLRESLKARDLDRIAEGTSDLELAGPVRSARPAGSQSAPPAPVVEALELLVSTIIPLLNALRGWTGR